MEKDVESLKDELEDLDECVDRETVVDLIYEIVPSLIGKKGLKGSKGSSSSSESSEEFDSAKTIVEINGKKMLIPYKQRRKARPRKIKRLVV